MPDKKIVFFIQARTISSRLPNKIFLGLADKPLLIRMIERVRRSRYAKNVVVITTYNKEDDPVAALCRREKTECFRGHPTDLLDRHYSAAKKYEAEIVIKIPSDCPLIDPAVIDKVVQFYLDNESEYDYVSNLHPPSYPDGNDVEVMSFYALETAWKEAKKDFEREHTTPYIWENPQKFRIGNVCWETGLNYSMTHRFTIDYREDYRFIKYVFEHLYNDNKNFGLKDILMFLELRKDVFEINSKYAGVNWYRNHLSELKTITIKDTKLTDCETI